MTISSRAIWIALVLCIFVSSTAAAELRVVTTTTDLADLVRGFCQHKVGAIPVVEGERVVGIVTQTDMMQAFLAVLEKR